MTVVETATIKGTRFASVLRATCRNLWSDPPYRWLFLLLGAPVHLAVWLVYLYRKKNDIYAAELEKTKRDLLAAGYKEELRAEMEERLLRKRQFFGQKTGRRKLDKQIANWTEARFREIVQERTELKLRQLGRSGVSYADTFLSLVERREFLILSFVPGVLMYGLALLYGNPYIKYIAERLVMTLFVVLGVIVVVFSILYVSPFNPAANILGETATNEQIAAFNKLYGLDQPYAVQLWNYIKGIFTFELGQSFTGNEDIASSIARKFPVTLTMAFLSLLLAMAVALPFGMIAAVKQNTFIDYALMFVVLIGLSVPNFWQGLIFILTFSIQLQWLPATYNPQNWISLVMPVVVLGTGLMASVARMTRSSVLDVIHEDYIVTARAKGLSRRQVLFKHTLRNAMIPIITVMGLQFGGMLSGAFVTEKVFNINGIGSYIVDKQFVPDVPGLIGGVVYVAIAISVVNVVVDILYAFIDPRIRSQLKQHEKRVQP